MSNQNEYGSLLDTFTALDCYNLPMPVVPPADLTIAAGDIASAFLSVRNSAASRVVGFDPNDNPYLRSVGLSSNYADGLVDASTLHQGGSTPSWRLQVIPVRMGTPIGMNSLGVQVGLCNIALNAVTSVVPGTNFFTQFAAKGMKISWHDANSVLRTATILTVTDDDNLVLTANIATTVMFTGASNNVVLVPFDILGASAGLSLPVPIMNTQFSFNSFLLAPGTVTPPQGKITATAGSAAIVGVGTSFKTDFAALGTCINPIIAWTDDLGVRRTGAVSSVTDNNNLTLTAVVVAGGTGTGVAMLDIDTSIRVLISWPAAFSAYTISIDPAYGQNNRRLSIHAIAEIEHTFPLVKTVFQ